jgi:hypothetical protein
LLSVQIIPAWHYGDKCACLERRLGFIALILLRMIAISGMLTSETSDVKAIFCIDIKTEDLLHLTFA